MDFSRRLSRERKIDFETLFLEALTRMVAEFGHDPSRARRTFDPLLTRGVVNKMLRLGGVELPRKESTKGEDPEENNDKPLENSSKNRLIWYYNGGQDQFLYRLVSDKMGNKRPERRSFIKEVKGVYTYFRHYAPTINHRKLEYVSGRIEISLMNEVPSFKHWSHNHSKQEPEHSGFVFHSGENMIMLGMGRKVVRLAHAELDEKDTMVDGKVVGKARLGLVLSLRTRSPNDPFAARFIMTRTGSPVEDLLKSTEPNTQVEENGRLMGATIGERAFFKITHGDYAYYMLVHDESEGSDRA